MRNLLWVVALAWVLDNEEISSESGGTVYIDERERERS